MLISQGHPDTDVTRVVFVEKHQLFIENIKIHINIDTKKIESFVL